MTTTQQGVITLIRSALTGETLSLPEDFSWEEADEIIRSQSLLPLAFQGAYRCGVPMDTDRMKAYRTQYFGYLARSEKQMQAVRQIFRAFEENGIDYLPLKGTILKELYPQPEMRPMGDADILIRMEQYDRIAQVMGSLGYVEKSRSKYDTHWLGHNLFVELHWRLFSSEEEDFVRHFGDSWSRAEESVGHRFHFSAEDTYAYVFFHMTKHFRTWGIGIRQILDLYVFHQKHPEMDESKVEKIMADINLLRFYRNIRKLHAVWIEGDSTDPVSDDITEYVFNSGNFGTLENVMYAKEAKANSTGKVKKSGYRSLFYAVFPTMSDLQLSYNILYKYPFLYPVFWVVRCVDILRHRPGNIRKKLGIIRNMTNEKVTAHQRALNYMGLDFHYEDSEEDFA